MLSPIRTQMGDHSWVNRLGL